MMVDRRSPAAYGFSLVSTRRPNINPLRPLQWNVRRPALRLTQRLLAFQLDEWERDRRISRDAEAQGRSVTRKGR